MLLLQKVMLLAFYLLVAWSNRCIYIQVFFLVRGGGEGGVNTKWQVCSVNAALQVCSSQTLSYYCSSKSLKVEDHWYCYLSSLMGYAGFVPMGTSPFQSSQRILHSPIILVNITYSSNSMYVLESFACKVSRNVWIEIIYTNTQKYRFISRAMRLSRFLFIITVKDERVLWVFPWEWRGGVRRRGWKKS